MYVVVILKRLMFFELKKKYNCMIIEDAYAFGAKYRFKDKVYKIGSCKHSDIFISSIKQLTMKVVNTTIQEII